MTLLDPSLATMRRARPRFAASQSIGRRSHALKTQHMNAGIWRVMAGVTGVVLAAMALGAVLGGIGFAGLFATALTCVLAAALLLRYPRLRVPTRARLAQGPLGEVVANTELWLETRRQDLPAAAREQVDSLGLQLDDLGLQLDHAEPRGEAAANVRRLVGEHLPEIIGAYTGEHRHLGDETALVDSLLRIGREIELITRRLAADDIDEFALATAAPGFGSGAPP